MKHGHPLRTEQYVLFGALDRTMARMLALEGIETDHGSQSSKSVLPSVP